jgi:hypothetical protein
MPTIIDREEKPKQEDKRKVYIKPEIIHELELETRAGSTITGMPDPLGDEFNP